MTGQDAKALFADACREAGYLVLSHADGKHGPAEGMPDLLIIGRWCGRQACVFLEFKSAREKLRPAQARFMASAVGVVDRGFVYRVVRQTPEAPGEISAVQAAAALGLAGLMAGLPKPGPGAVFEEAQVSSDPCQLTEVSVRAAQLVAEGYGRVAAARIAAAEADQAGQYPAYGETTRQALAAADKAEAAWQADRRRRHEPEGV